MLADRGAGMGACAPSLGSDEVCLRLSLGALPASRSNPCRCPEVRILHLPECVEGTLAWQSVWVVCSQNLFMPTLRFTREGSLTAGRGFVWDGRGALRLHVEADQERRYREAANRGLVVVRFEAGFADELAVVLGELGLGELLAAEAAGGHGGLGARRL